MINIVGGTYTEICAFPEWNQLLGSGLRSALALSKLTNKIKFYTCVNSKNSKLLNRYSRAYNINTKKYYHKNNIVFTYLNPFLNPSIEPIGIKKRKNIYIQEKNILKFGMLECDFITHGNKVVYDPQSPIDPKPYTSNGSTYNELTIILNEDEAYKLYGYTDNPEYISKKLKNDNDNSIIIIKCGSRGAVTITKKYIHKIPVYKTKYVWSIGSGDVFSAIYSYFWAVKNLNYVKAANLASIATAYYVNSKSLQIPKNIKSIKYPKLNISNIKLDKQIYLAGPFFNISQVWFLNETRNIFLKEGLNVFSPYHDVGFGNDDTIARKDLDGIKKCDVLFALLDDVDIGTIFEIGYAIALSKPVFIYLNNKNDLLLKMLRGSKCSIYYDYSSAIYNTIWSFI